MAMHWKEQGFGYMNEQRYGLITSLSIHSLIFIMFFALSLHKDSDVKTFYIQFTQMDQQSAVQSLQPVNEINSPNRNELPGNEIKQNSVIEETPVKEPEPVKEVIIPAPIPEPVREIEKPKVAEPKPEMIKETPIREYEAVIRDTSLQSHEAAKVASSPAPNPQPRAQSLPQPQTGNHKGRAGTAGSLSYSASSGQPAVIETTFGSSGAPVFLNRQMPVYPMMAKKLGKQGKVVLRLHINEKGRLLNVEVVEDAGYGFTESAIEAVRMSTFSPAHEKGAGIASKALLTIRFVLKKV
jgi:TonB family protein